MSAETRERYEMHARVSLKVKPLRKKKKKTGISRQDQVVGQQILV